MAARKKGGFAAQMADLLDSRAPKEVDLEDDGPRVDAADDWEGGLYEEAEALMQGLGSKKAPKGDKKLRMRGNLSHAFSEGTYKGKVVDSSNAFGEEGSEEGDDSADMEGDDGTDDGSIDYGDEIQNPDDESESIDDESEGDDAAQPSARESRAGLQHLKKATLERRQRLQAERDPEEPYPTGDVDDSLLDSDEFEIENEGGAVNEAAISTKMDDIFAGLDDEDDDIALAGAGETYESFLKKEQTSRKKHRVLKRKREDFDSVGEGDSEQHDSDREEDDDIARQIAEIHAATQQSGKSLVRATEDDQQRSTAARNQYKIWSKLVACRIHLQQPMSWAARLPAAYAYSDAVPEGSEERKSLSAASASLQDFMEDLHGLRESLLDMNPSFKGRGALRVPPRPELSKKQQKRNKASGTEPAAAGVDVDRCWRLCVASHSTVGTKMDEALDYWHSRALMQSAQASEAQMKPTDPATKQIRLSLQRDSDRLVKRTQKNRCGRLPFGHPNSEDVKRDPRVLQTPEFLHNADTFDDSDFYSWLLTDYIHNSADAKLGGAEELADAQRLAKDPGRLLVDKKRSKARKLSFEAHPKMIGFQAPRPQDVPAFVDQLYTTLFASA
eukprot:TRINITY_DN14271_c2_g1_i1.p2 TRINITY_DN14271_c2_g1~~TRINITY_DN14271_c2_g1_i1.p2  ORF type:complete len:614 (+),score=282.76 TRINITY_DN14271_c2_g1_i1:76-1917(+)